MSRFQISYEYLANDLINKIIDDEKRNSVLFKAIYISFTIISAIMTLINIITMRKALLIATASFTVLCFIDLILAVKSPKYQKIASYMFALEAIILFSFFIVTGGTDNFSIVWVLLLPTLGLFFFGLKIGSFLCGIVYLVMLATFYIPSLHALCTDYGDTFTTRFPIVFMASYAVSFLLEAIRFYTAQELNSVKEKYHALYKRDPLTGLYNRYGLEDTLNSISDSSDKQIGILIFDIDFFKAFNDTYGHECGDYILKELGKIVSESLPTDAVLHRWGGEEFLAVYPSANGVFENAQKICNMVSDYTFTYEEKKLKLTISIGVITCDNLNKGDSYDGLISIADGCLYEAKETGRNKVVSKAL